MHYRFNRLPLCSTNVVLAVAKVAWFSVLLFGAGHASAAYPDRPIRLVVPAAPGGAIDVVGRIMGVKLSDALAQNVVIDNRAGANNIIGTEIVRPRRARRLHAADHGRRAHDQ